MNSKRILNFLLTIGSFKVSFIGMVVVYILVVITAVTSSSTLTNNVLSSQSGQQEYNTSAEYMNSVRVMQQSIYEKHNFVIDTYSLIVLDQMLLGIYSQKIETIDQPLSYTISEVDNCFTPAKNGCVLSKLNTSDYQLLLNIYQENLFYRELGFSYPQNDFQITSSFYGRVIEGEEWEVHGALDTSSGFESDVHAIDEGKVIRSQQGCDPEGGDYGNVCNGGRGNNIYLLHEKELIVNQFEVKFMYYTVYFHLKTIFVTEGEEVSPGDTIATEGNSGSSTGSHLHFGLGIYLGDEYLDDLTKRVDPFLFLLPAKSADIKEDKIEVMNESSIEEEDYLFADYIVTHESNWNYQATNQESGAYGLCQALPPEKMAYTGKDWKTNPITQLNWCDNYAKQRYGSWEKAYIFWLEHSWW